MRDVSLLIWLTDKFHGSPHRFSSICGATHMESEEPNITEFQKLHLICAAHL